MKIIITGTEAAGRDEAAQAITQRVNQFLGTNYESMEIPMDIAPLTHHDIFDEAAKPNIATVILQNDNFLPSLAHRLKAHGHDTILVSLGSDSNRDRNVTQVTNVNYHLIHTSGFKPETTEGILSNVMHVVEKANFNPRARTGMQVFYSPERLILDTEDWTESEWAVLCKLLGLLPKQTSHIDCEPSIVKAWVSSEPEKYEYADSE